MNILGKPPDAWQWPLHTPAFVLPAFALTRAQAAWMQEWLLYLQISMQHAE